jgi:hypothetical protein
LSSPTKHGREARRRPGEQHEQPGRERIERAGVPVLPGAAAQLGDERERRRAGRLVDERDADGLQRRGGIASRPSRGDELTRMNSAISSIDSSLEKPAA